MKRREFLYWAGALPVATKAAPVDELFIGNRLQDIALEFDEGDWATLRERYLTNDWYWCRVSWNGVTARAAARSRGNGSRNPVKPSLKLDFNRGTGTGPFFGLQSLLLNNFAQDPSCLKNASSLLLFAKMGLPAPRTSYARVHVNGRYQGLHAVVEEIDSLYLERWFSQSGGWLYEYDWADEYWFDRRGVHQDEDYVPAPFELKNNSRNAQTAVLRQFVEAINAAPDEELTRALAPFLDVHQYLTLLAVEAFTDERDGQAGEWGINGFFLYRFANSTKFAFLPWDKDWSFMDYGRPALYRMQNNVLARRLLSQRASRQFFLDELERCARLAGAAGGWLESEARARLTAIGNAAVTDPNFIQGNGHFGPETAKVLAFIQRRATEILRQIPILRTQTQ